MKQTTMKIHITYILILALGSLISLNSNAQIINTIAGTGVAAYNGDGIAAVNAQLNTPVMITTDAAGNLYIADALNYRIRKITTSGLISTIAGTGVAGFSGDGTAASNAQISIPQAIAIDSMGNIYVSDGSNHRIRKINAAGIISTVVGTGVSGYSGDSGLATNATIFAPLGIALDALGNLYISDRNNFRIRKVNTSGIISTIAGTGTQGFSGDAGLAINANIYGPSSITVDTAGNVYFCDNQRIRKINTAGIISTIAGTGAVGFNGDGGLATSATLYYPSGLTFDKSGDLYFGDTDNNRVRKINSSGIISTEAGTGISGFSGDGSLAINAHLQGPNCVTFDVIGNMYISDFRNQRIRKVNALTTSSNQLKQNSPTLSIYPNPNNGVFTIQSTTEGIFFIINELGQTIQAVKLNSNNNYNITAKELSNGIYFIFGLNNNQLIKQKIVVTH